MATVALSRVDRVGVGLWFVLGTAPLVVGAREYLIWGASKFVITLSAVAVVSVLTGLSIAKTRKLGRWLGGLGGLVLVLYALALVFLGSEDVGGLGVSVPAAILLAAFGVWNVAAAAGRE
jgi:hypothetical protein